MSHKRFRSSGFSKSLDYVTYWANFLHPHIRRRSTHPPPALSVTSSLLALSPSCYSSPVSGARLVGGDSEWKDGPHPRELCGVPLTEGPAEVLSFPWYPWQLLSPVLQAISLPPRSAGWLTLLLPVNTSVCVNFGVTHPHDHLSWPVVTLQETEVNQQGRPFDFENQEKGWPSHLSHSAPKWGALLLSQQSPKFPTFWKWK